MKILTWVVALCNRKWQREFDAMVAEIESAPETDHIEYCEPIIPDQPTHLSRQFKSRPRRHHKHSNVQVMSNKEMNLTKLMKTELAKLA